MNNNFELAGTHGITTRVRLLLSGVALAAVSLVGAEASHAEARAKGSEWELAWRDTFDGNTLGNRWEVVDHESYEWDRFSQYYSHAQKLRGGNLVITLRQHCVADSEVGLTLANAQVEPCGPDEHTMYSAGRVEQAIPDIEGDYRIDMKIKMPRDPRGTPQQGIRFAAWRNNITKNDPDSANAGYCTTGSTTPTGEGDLIEYYPEDGVDKVRAAHHRWCEDGQMSEVSRVKRFPDGWLSKFHVYSEERIDGRVTYSVDGERIQLRNTNKTRYADKPRDFHGVTHSEQITVDQYPNSIIFDSRVFVDAHAASPIFRPPDPTQPFHPQHMKISEVSVYSIESRSR